MSFQIRLPCSLSAVVSQASKIVQAGAAPRYNFYLIENDAVPDTHHWLKDFFRLPKAKLRIVKYILK
jgi:hypothetical protein